MSLQEKLAAKKEEASGMIPEQIQQTFQNFSAWLKNDSGVEQRALAEGDRAPAFVLPNAQGGDFGLAMELAKGPVAILFYRGLW
jgi:hypothetical protein